MSGILAILAGKAFAEPWSIEPRLGASAEYDSNPSLSAFDPKSEEHVAALFDVPLRYDEDDFAFVLAPSGRVSNSRGYSSLASNYFHVASSAQLTSELGSTSIQTELGRDSSLYHAGGFVDGIGVRRDSVATSADWTRSMTERSQAALDVSWTRVSYAELPQVTGLIDYRYLSAGPTVAFRLDERDTLKVLGNYGRYQSRDGFTESKSENLQLAFDRQLGELWSLSTSAGYLRATNSQKYFFGPFYLGTFKSNQNSGVYSASLTHQGEQFNYGGGAARALQPTGFAYLTSQDNVYLFANYIRSERWDFAMNASWQNTRNPALGLGRGESSSVRFLNAQLTANWHWTAQWIITTRVTRVEYGQSPVRVGAGSLSLEINRHFLRTDL